MLYSGTDPVSYITEYTLVYEEKTSTLNPRNARNPWHPRHLATRNVRRSVQHFSVPGQYRDTSLIRNSAPPGPYSRTMLRALWWF